jgi:serine/threonine-protein kinase HipA
MAIRSSRTRSFHLWSANPTDVPGFASIADLVRRASANPLRDITYLVRIALYNLLIGNCDAHGKNFSLIYRGTDIALAPFYDLVSTAVYPELAAKLSMRIGGEYRVDHIGKAELEGFAKDLGVRTRFVADELKGLVQTARDAQTEVAALPELQEYATLVSSMMDGWAKRVTISAPILLASRASHEPRDRS